MNKKTLKILIISIFILINSFFEVKAMESSLGDNFGKLAFISIGGFIGGAAWSLVKEKFFPDKTKEENQKIAIEILYEEFEKENVFFPDHFKEKTGQAAFERLKAINYK
jgi:hypothetical protein